MGVGERATVHLIPGQYLQKYGNHAPLWDIAGKCDIDKDGDSRGTWGGDSLVHSVETIHIKKC